LDEGVRVALEYIDGNPMPNEDPAFDDVVQSDDLKAWERAVRIASALPLRNQSGPARV
jgi:hypothetical protein